MHSSSIALALKYRPRRFEDLIGQETISRTLSLALDKKRLSHAYLFSGLRGSGKTSTARIFAKALICEQGESSTPCETCSHCESANAGKHIDIIEMDAASNRKIDDIRDLIEQTKYQPASARYKVFIIDEVHMLTKEAFNALLKTLEEPPNYIKFILATTDPLKLPATILSRTQHFRFKNIAQSDIVHHITTILNQEEIEFEPKALDIIARSGKGSLRDTLTLLDQAILYAKGNVDAQSVTEMLGLLDPAIIERLFGFVFAGNKEALISLIESFHAYEAEVLLDEITEFLKERFFTSIPPFNAFVTERFFRVVAETRNLLSLNADSGFALSLMILKFLEALKPTEIDQRIATLENELKAPESTSSTIPSSSSTRSHEPESSQKPKAAPPTPTTTPIPVIEETDSSKNTLDTNAMFAQLVQSLYNLDAELGKCFDNNVRFISYEANTIQWMSCAEDECKKMLIHYWSPIKHQVKEVFGFETIIKNVPCDEAPPSPTPPAQQKQEPQANTTSGSMIEEVELGEAPDEEISKEPSLGSSCVQNAVCGPSPEFDSREVLKSSFVKKAIKLFDAESINVQAKV